MTLKNQYNIKTVVFDLGGVYFTPGSYLVIEKIKEIYDIVNESLLEDIFSDLPNTDGNLIRRGLITIEEFEKRLFMKINIQNKDRDHIRYIWFGSYCIHYGIEAIIKELKKSYRIVVFSGNIKERVEYLNKKCDFLKYFEDTVFSYDYHKNKDDLEFYKELINHIDCDPSEAILIDDEKKNIQMARSLGFNGIHFYYTEKLLKDLKKFNINLNISLD
ncbi:MAG: HAD-IA family hydrolase [Candidatus Thorarchaeota archaeon]